MSRPDTLRLDKLLVQRGLAPEEKRARALIMAGNVLVAENVVDKVGALVRLDAAVRLKRTDCPYVSRGGLKLRAALEHFHIDVRGLAALDVGASTGGFTDCLLQAGAAKVYALDVGYGQLAWKLREDKRVVLIERTNIRRFTGAGLTEKAALATIDASFISLRLVIPAVLNHIAADAALLALIKPQFEVEKKELGACGVVEDPVQHRRVIEELASFCEANHLDVAGVCASPLLGPAGNREFFIYSRKRGEGR